jgi:VacB/RNase II family 3'-5' exoribonuclease
MKRALAVCLAAKPRSWTVKGVGRNGEVAGGWRGFGRRTRRTCPPGASAEAEWLVMTNTRSDLRAIAHRAMLERGLAPDFSDAELAEVRTLSRELGPVGTTTRDLRGLAWCSIDNDDSRDLDQLSVAEGLPGGRCRILVAVADVDSRVTRGSAVDDHAQTNTTSVYTDAVIFPMLPEVLSTDITSLNEGEERLALVTDLVVDGDGVVTGSDVYRARVFNQAKLAYNAVGPWLEGTGPAPTKVAAVDGLVDNLRRQDEVAHALRARRRLRGALDLETLEPRATFDGDVVSDLRLEQKNRAKELIEDLMIAANVAVAHFLQQRGCPSFRRVLRSPERWERIVSLAQAHGASLPSRPDAGALEGFLVEQRAKDPVRFPDLSLAVVKLLGRGEYALELPGRGSTEHFGLAVKDYTHSTAPNRRFPDLLTQRLVKAALAGRPVPYGLDELSALAQHCTVQEDAAAKVERQVRKSAAAMLMQRQIGDRFEGIVTGASAKGTWVRLFRPPVEGRVVRGFQGLDVGDRVMVKLVHTDVERGFVDFSH